MSIFYCIILLYEPVTFSTWLYVAVFCGDLQYYVAFGIIFHYFELTSNSLKYFAVICDLLRRLLSPFKFKCFFHVCVLFESVRTYGVKYAELLPNDEMSAINFKCLQNTAKLAKV